MLLTGYLIVERIPWLKAHVEQVVIAIIFISVLPGIVGWWKSRAET